MVNDLEYMFIDLVMNNMQQYISDVSVVNMYSKI